MVRSLSVNELNDIYLDPQGNLAIAVGLTAILQNCEHAARAVLGEMVLEVDRGIPYFETVWAGNPQISQFDAALRRALLAVEGVIEVVNLSTTPEDNQLNYTALIRTTFGEGTASGTI